MKTTYLPSLIFILVMSACNNKSSEQVIDDPGSATVTTVATKKTVMKGFKTNIESDALKNVDYRKVLYTGEHMQLVLMSLKPGEEIGEETHLKSDQFFRIESGSGKCIVNNTTYNVEAGDVVLVPWGARHNVINTNPKNDLKLYTIYAQPNHRDGIVRVTKDEAEKNEAKFDGKTTE